jgi:hypothetical protein
MYYASFENRTVAADATQDIFSLMAGANNKCRIHGWEITSADIAAEILRCQLRKITATGSGGNAETEEPNDDDDSAATAAVRTADGTQGGSPGNGIQSFQWEQLGPLGMVYTPEMRPVVAEGEGIALILLTATGFTMSGWICWEEI